MVELKREREQEEGLMTVQLHTELNPVPSLEES
jgi:hypothetical protein